MSATRRRTAAGVSLVLAALAALPLAAQPREAGTRESGTREPGARGGDVLAGPVPAQVLRVVDGDTVVVRARIWLRQDVETAVRLAGVNAPELHGRCEEERRRAVLARDFLERHVLGTPVQLRDVRLDKYGGRVVARLVLHGGWDAGEQLIAQGLARPYAGGTRAGWC